MIKYPPEEHNSENPLCQYTQAQMGWSSVLPPQCTCKPVKDPPAESEWKQFPKLAKAKEEEKMPVDSWEKELDNLFSYQILEGWKPGLKDFIRQLLSQATEKAREEGFDLAHKNIVADAKKIGAESRLAVIEKIEKMVKENTYIATAKGSAPALKVVSAKNLLTYLKELKK